MARTTARPSDIYRLPEYARQAPPRANPPSPSPPDSRFPGWMAIAGVVSAVLVIIGIVRGSTTATTGEAPLVDVVTEDHAIAALTLYGAQASAIEELRRREDIYDGQGPGAAAAVAARGVSESQRALDDAREVVGADPLASGYWNSGAHSDVIEYLRELHQLAELIALLSATHDTIYGGTGAVPLPVARDRLNAEFAGGRRSQPLPTWADALLQQMEDRDRAAAAAQAREDAAQLWAFRVREAEPAAPALIGQYLRRLPPETITGLRGHPVAGPALESFERDRGRVD